MKALIIVDMQNDFMPKGPLGVPRADTLVPGINALMPHFPLVIATQDWHPKNHLSFASNHPGKKVGDTVELAGLPQVLWPEHCIQNTPGAELVPSLDQSRIDKIIHKGTDPSIDSYSTFFDNAHRKQTPLAAYLKAHGVDTLYLAGVATEFCVYYSALDALSLGFQVFVVEDACAGINLTSGAVEEVLNILKSNNITIIKINSIISNNVL